MIRWSLRDGTMRGILLRRFKLRSRLCRSGRFTRRDALVFPVVEINHIGFWQGHSSDVMHVVFTLVSLQRIR